MNKDNKEKISAKEAFIIQLRAYRLIKSRCPGLFFSGALHAFFEAVTPYVSIYCSAQLINELAATRRPDILWKWAVLTISLSSVLALLTGAALRWNKAALQKRYIQKEEIFGEKMRSLDFADTDSAETKDLFSQILQNENWMGLGLMKLTEVIPDMVRGFAGIVGSAALTVSLFTSVVPDSAGKLTALNSIAFSLSMTAILFVIALLAPACKNKANAIWAYCGDEYILMGNRLFNAMLFLPSRWADNSDEDIRMYEQYEISRHYMKNSDICSSRSPLGKIMRGSLGLWNGASGATGAALTGVVYVFVCLKAWAGAFGVGSVTQYVGAITALARSVSLFAESAGTLRSNLPHLKNTFRFIDMPNNMYQGSLTTEKRSDRNYSIEFKDVSFKYPGSELYALRHVNMKFNVGSRMAVVGENGSGKTTFIKLLCRLYDPTEGEILLNGINIRKYNYSDYIALFAAVFQDFQLISQPLGANVAGAENYDRERAGKALRDAGFGERLDSMPLGLDTMLYKDYGEDGVEISGGEAQKIAIARALYKDAPFIILDEPTAALDPVAEAEIYSRFNDIVNDKTAIYISHRLSSCKFCDVISVFDHGSVIQQGNHEELLEKKDGKYAELWNAQAQYYT